MIMLIPIEPIGPPVSPIIPIDPIGPICGTSLSTITTLFFLGVIIGAVIILCLKLRGTSFKRKHGFKDTEMMSLKDMNPGEGSAHHAEHKETVDGSDALKDFKHQ